jgi:hypothetical protein
MITIRPASGTELYHRYPQQTTPQPCHVELGLARGTLTAAHDPVVGSGAPEAVYLGHVRRFTIPALRADAANALLERIAPLAERAQAGYSTRWDGRANVAAFSADALAALDAIDMMCADTFAARADGLVAVQAEDWFRVMSSTCELRAREFSITAATTDDELEGVAAKERASATAGHVDIIDGLDDYLRMLRDAARQAA